MRLLVLSASNLCPALPTRDAIETIKWAGAAVSREQIRAAGPGKTLEYY
jgi:hypothetical protein